VVLSAENDIYYDYLNEDLEKLSKKLIASYSNFSKDFSYVVEEKNIFITG
jgi:hypothetical protein